AGRSRGLQRECNGVGAVAHGHGCTDVDADRAVESRHRRAARRTVLDGRGEHDPLRRPHARRAACRGAARESSLRVRPPDERARRAVCGAGVAHGGARERVRARNAARALRRTEVPMRCAAALLLAAARLVACDRAAPAGVDIALADSGAGNPTVAIADRAGSAFAAWIETVDGESNVY